MRRLLALIALLAAGALSAGCHNKAEGTPPVPAQKSGGFPRTLTDSRGQAVTLNAAPQHIVSLIPSDTEVLYALGAGDRIVAVTTADDYPPEVKTKPTITNVLTADVEQI
ncbi:MAG: periplasmic binding protein, partial [Chthonomonadales bacterium]|nr:periplasmic binding protein [Chthonomonadales bacterium]